MTGRNRIREAPVDEEPVLDESWESFGFEPDAASGWLALGFSPFEAALAHGDGYTPMFAEHYVGPLHKIAAPWLGAGLGTPDGLRWHLAGFTAREATQWRALAVDLETARRRRSGFQWQGQ